MYTKLSKIMTLCGLVAMVFYAIMLSFKGFSWEVMPQFTIAALMFLSSGHITKKIVRHLQQRGGSQPISTIDFQLLFWVTGLTVLMSLALLLLVPFGVSLTDTYLFRLSQQLCNSSWTP